MYVVHALLGVGPAGTDEASVHAATLDEAIARIRELVEHRPDFRAITLLHTEDHPPILGGSKVMGAAVSHGPLV